MSLYLLLVGEQRLRTESGSAAPLLDLCLRESLSICAPLWEEDGSLSFSCSARTASRLLGHCRAEGIPLPYCRAVRGLPRLFTEGLRRPGLLLGCLLSLCLLFLAPRFLWDIRVSGNEQMTTGEVLEELRACGLTKGRYLPAIQVPALENRILISSDRIAWISVNLLGNVAEVQVVERVPPPAEEASSPANLVAACDGQIEVLQLYRGNAMVKVGQAVRKGELLVSGIYDGGTEGYRYTRATGEVLARTERTLQVEIPLSYEKKVYSDGECAEILLNFFDFSVKIFKKAGNWDASCDIIEREIGSALPGLSDLPLQLAVRECVPYRIEKAVRTEEEAVELAFLELERELAALSLEAELLEKRITVTVTDTSVLLDCTLRCIENIARQVAFEVVE